MDEAGAGRERSRDGWREGLRRACLIGAAVFMGYHLLLWVLVVPGSLARPAATAEPLTVGVLGTMFGVLAFGVAGLVLPLRALARPGGPGPALGCALLAAGYLAMFLAAWIPGPGGALPDAPALRALGEGGSMLVVAALLLGFLTFGAVEEPAVFAFAYAAALLVGAALTARGGVRPRPPPGAGAAPAPPGPTGRQAEPP